MQKVSREIKCNLFENLFTIYNVFFRSFFSMHKKSQFLEMPSHLKIMLDYTPQKNQKSKYESNFMYGRPDDAPPKEAPPKVEEEANLKYMEGGYTSFDTRAMQCSFQCFPGTVTKKFVPMSMMGNPEKDAEVADEDEGVPSGGEGSGIVDQESDKPETTTTNLDDVLESFLIDV